MLKGSVLLLQTATGFSIELRRRVGQHFVNMYAPTALLVVVSFVREEINDSIDDGVTFLEFCAVSHFQPIVGRSKILAELGKCIGDTSLPETKYSACL